MEELTHAVKQMKRHKTPGISGLTADFYKMFYNQLKDILLSCINGIYLQKNHPTHMTTAVINLIPKQDKDTRLLKNLRPISLLNVDYKLIEKMIATRLERSLDYIVSIDQKGFRKGMRMAANIRKIMDIMTLADERDLDAIILSLDFEKCFDKVEHCALIGSLEYFGFSEYLVEWTKILYQDFTATVQNNGYLTYTFMLTKGIRQGGPASSFYFLICAEILAIQLKSNSSIKGILVDDICELLLGQFADDMDIYLLFEQKHLTQVFKVLERFRLSSGFTVNYDKTQIYRIGSLKFSAATLVTLRQVQWTNTQIKVLGVMIHYDTTSCMNLNYEPIIQKAGAMLKTWQSRGLSLIGKVLVVNTLIESLFVHKMFVLPTLTDNMIIVLDHLVQKFVWNDKKPKIAKSILQANKHVGGLRLVNFKLKDKALKITWIKQLLLDKQLAQLVYSIISPVLGDKIWMCNIHPEDVERVIPKLRFPFWHDVLLAWAEYRQDLPIQMEHAIDFIWYNSVIRISDSPFVWSSAYEQGLFYVSQIFVKGVPISAQTAQQSFGLSQMQLNSLISATPGYLKDPYYDATQTVSEETVFLQMNSRAIYHCLTNDRSVMIRSHSKWQEELAISIEYGDFLALFQRIYSITNIAKYRSFQYRLLARGITTNVHMNKWQVIENNLCSFCGLYPELYSHLFFNCEKVQRLWVELKEHVAPMCNLEMQFGLTNVIFNNVVNQPQHVVNFIILVAKQYIYRQ